MASTISVPNETISIGSRTTREGRKITYSLKVIQQPERARACGSGAKSSADRRPVDPPPIVELKVFEGQNAEKDITFPYRANFFLFATLENARTMVQGRLPTPATFPVLTGTPVAGMAYLDRPDQAGYFIFPDLSVRHEGKYRLSFTLYEEVKEQQDMDPESSQSIQVQASGIDAYVSHRLEVKSKPFTVYSAKKFPGLAESTQLSRMVADQGCRVRIRRDVRMRKRESTKGGDKDWDDYEDKTAEDRARASATPDNYGQPNAPTSQGIIETRPPSSNSNHSLIAPLQRRPSMSDVNQGYPQDYSQAMAHPQPQPQNNGYHAPQPYANAPPPTPYSNNYPPSQHGSGMMQPPPTPFNTSPPAYPAPSQPQQHQQQQQQMNQNYGYMQNHGYPTPTYDQHSPMRHEGMDYGSGATFRRPSIPQPQGQGYPASAGSPYNQMEPHRQPSIMHSMPPLQPSIPSSNAPHMNASLAPLKTEKLEPISPTYMNGGMSASPPSDMQYGAQNKYGAPAPQLGAKRTFAESFDTKHLNQPLRGGARPTVPSSEFGGNDFDDAEDAEFTARAMSYRRADGSQRSRRIPVAEV